jgi:hypothetical protein
MVLVTDSCSLMHPYNLGARPNPPLVMAVLDTAIQEKPRHSGNALDCRAKPACALTSAYVGFAGETLRRISVPRRSRAPVKSSTSPPGAPGQVFKLGGRLRTVPLGWP